MTLFKNTKFVLKHQDSYGEKKYEIVEGKLQILKNGDRIYSYQSENKECEIILKNKFITIKIGENIFKISFNRRNKILYKNENLEFELFILGKNYSYNQSTKIFTVIYEIFDSNNQKLNEINFSVKEF